MTERLLTLAFYPAYAVSFLACTPWLAWMALTQEGGPRGVLTGVATPRNLLDMTTNETTPAAPNALYTDADGTTLVVLDDTDCFLETVATLTDDEVEALLAGETDLRVTSRTIEIGDGDTFRRVEAR